MPKPVSLCTKFSHSVSQSVSQSVNQSVRQSVSLSVSQSVCLSVCLLSFKRCYTFLAVSNYIYNLKQQES